MSGLTAARVEVAQGDGLLARRADAVLFVSRPPIGPAATWAATLDAFVGATDTGAALDAVLDHAIDQHLEVGPFAVVTWGANVHVVVFGDVTVVSDLPSVPRLSGAGMPTWVEHRATRIGGRAEVRLGDQPVEGSDLLGGIVPAGGFRLVLVASTATETVVSDAPRTPTPAAAPPTPPVHVAPVTAENPVSDATRTTPTPAASPPTPPAPPARVAPVTAENPVSGATRTTTPSPAQSSWDVLRDAGGAWMDDSLQLSEPRLNLTAPPPPEPAPPTPVDLEPSTATRTTPSADPFDPEVTLDAGALTGRPQTLDGAPPEPQPLARSVQARRCDLGHLNPPLRTRCRVCEHYLPPDTPVETVPQPVLATLVVGDGRTIDVAGPVVLGRIPSADAARLDEPGALVALGDATVSRTHALVTVDGWTLLAVDCGATAGTAIAPAGGDPALLEAWVPHELAIGDTLFLGGPTKVQVVARHD